MNVNAASFRDPFGCVFSAQGKIYRSVFQPGVKEFEAARDEGIFRELIDAGLLLSHKEVQIGSLAPEGTVYCLNHPKLPMISYPWEWSFSMLKDAALLHLDIMDMLLPRGFWLRDANAFNVQFDGRGLRLIDTLSVGRRVPESPWVAYSQFCSHFLAPLALAAYCDIRTLSLWRNYIDGYPLDLAVRMLPFWKRYRPRLFMHLGLHARFQDLADRKEDMKKATLKKMPKVSDRGLIGIVRSLRHAVNGVTWKRKSRIWEEYKNIRTYQTDDVAQKSEYVEKVVNQLAPKIIWDMGANTGEFSIIAAKGGAFVVSIDGDAACTEYLYQKSFKEECLRNILPLTMDLANPTPPLGWNSEERLSLRDRAPADLTLALALIHHLVLSSCVPLGYIAKWFASISNYLLVEFVPPSDPMVKKLLKNRRGEHLPYDLEAFRLSFGNFFDFVDERALNNKRILFFCKRKGR